jgi:sugar phosphate isomerase/epimerase
VTPRLLASTTSHKKEPLLPALDVFARLGLRDIDLNLHHLLEDGVAADDVADAIAAHGQQVWVVSGGWCDFFHNPPAIDDTWRSIARQVDIARRLGAGTLRLFFGRLTEAAYGPAALDTIGGNLHRLSDQYQDVTFVFENHDGASLVPAICRAVLERASRPNIRMNFDPINFERAGVACADALATCGPFIAHVHLKGLERGHYCEFGKGDVDLTPVLRSLLAQRYGGQFTVEYEGPFDGTLRLYQSMQRARAIVEALRDRSASAEGKRLAGY